ncbi:MAG: hypothetical protein LBF15_05975 [Candidatus Peribacteria bacterium]|nr:hypothetical protein [Candidatus Peribacteria bacterium]
MFHNSSVSKIIFHLVSYEKDVVTFSHGLFQTLVREAKFQLKYVYDVFKPLSFFSIIFHLLLYENVVIRLPLAVSFSLVVIFNNSQLFQYSFSITTQEGEIALISKSLLLYS